jgi:tyrosine-specific transport protein
MTAYVIAASVVIADVTGLGFLLSSLILVTGLYMVIARGVTLVDAFNRYLMVGMMGFYILLVCTGFGYIETERLVRADFSLAWASLPILVISFGYHNLIGSLVSYLNRDAKALYKAIVIGSFIPLLVYVLWEFVIIGLVPMHNITEWITAEKKGELVTQVLAETVGSKSVLYFSQGFAFFAIATSFLPVAFSFGDFLKDGFRLLGKNLPNSKSALLVLVPPLLLSLSDPSLFLDALDFAGGFCAVTLFGILPVIMAAKRGLVKYSYLVPIFVMSCVIFVIELLHQLGKL